MRLILSYILLVVVLPIKAQEPTGSLTRELQEVIVTAHQPATKLVGNTLVSTIPGSNLQHLGTCLDVLAQLPMITVTDDAVLVVGKGAPDIYIDGRPLMDNDELRQLNSSNIASVQLILAPGAMYAGGTTAVLKIVTRRRFRDGLSLTDRVELEARRKRSANEMLSLNYRLGAWDIFSTGTIARHNRLIRGTTVNTLNYQGVETVVGSSQDKSMPSTNGVVKAGFNYCRGKQSFGAYYRFNPERGNFSNEGTEWLDDEEHVRRNVSNTVHGRSHLVSAYYDNTFSGKYLLHFDGTFRNSITKNGFSTVYRGGALSDITSDDSRHSSLWAGKLYIGFPLMNGNFTIGTQNSYTQTKLDFRMNDASVGEYIPSSLTDAGQTSAAVFAMWSRLFGRFSLSAGLRYEYVDYIFKVNGHVDNDVSHKDNLFTPDISLGWNFNERSRISLSYRLKTVKPPYSQLTGSLSYIGRHEIEGGNPALRDELIHDVQLFGAWNDFVIQAGYRRSLDSYGFVKRVYPAATLQLLLQPINVDISDVSLYLMWNKTVRSWTPGVTVGMYKQWLELDGKRYDRPLFSYYVDNTFSLPDDFICTVNLRGQGKGHMSTNCFDASWFTFDASVCKYFFNKALQIKLSATDVFNTANNNWSMSTCGISVRKKASYDNRGVSLSLTYRFQPRQSKYKGKEASESELNRL